MLARVKLDGAKAREGSQLQSLRGWKIPLCRKRSDRHIQDQRHICHLRASQILQYGDQIQQFVVVRIREPTANRHRVLRVKNV